jgi:hypothetical protein
MVDSRMRLPRMVVAGLVLVPRSRQLFRELAVQYKKKEKEKY